MSDSVEKGLTEKGSSVTENLWSVRVENANRCSDLNAKTALWQHMKEEMRRSLANEFEEAQKTYVGMVEVIKLKNQYDFADG